MGARRGQDSASPRRRDIAPEWGVDQATARVKQILRESLAVRSSAVFPGWLARKAISSRTMSGMIGQAVGGNLDPIERQDLGRRQHIRATVFGYRSTTDDVEHVSVLLIVVAALSQARGGRLSRGVQLRDHMLVRGDEPVAQPDVDDVDSGQRPIRRAQAAGAGRIPPITRRYLSSTLWTDMRVRPPPSGKKSSYRVHSSSRTS